VEVILYTPTSAGAVRVIKIVCEASLNVIQSGFEMLMLFLVKV